MIDTASLIVAWGSMVVFVGVLGCWIYDIWSNR